MILLDRIFGFHAKIRVAGNLFESLYASGTGPSLRWEKSARILANSNWQVKQFSSVLTYNIFAGRVLGPGSDKTTFRDLAGCFDTYKPKCCHEKLMNQKL